MTTPAYIALQCTVGQVDTVRLQLLAGGLECSADCEHAVARA